MAFELSFASVSGEVMKGMLNAVGGLIVYALVILVLLNWLSGDSAGRVRQVVYMKNPYLGQALDASGGAGGVRAANDDAATATGGAAVSAAGRGPWG